MKVTNNTAYTLNFHKAGAKPKDGVMPTESIAPGETLDLDVDADSAELRAHVFAGAVTVSGAGAAKVAPPELKKHP